MANTNTGLAFVAKPVTRLESAERAAWLALIECHPANRKAFMTPAYADAIAAVNASAIVLIAYSGDQAVAFMPLQRRSDVAGRLGAYEPVGGVMTDYFGWVAEPSFHCNMTAVLHDSNLPLIVFTHLEAGQLQHGLAGDAPRTGLQTYIEEPVAEFWSRLRETDKKFVSDTERRERKLTKDHGELRFELDSSSPRDDLMALISLKCAQYERTSKQLAPLFEQRNVDLLFRLLDERSPECMGMLSTLKIGERLVAAHFGLRCHETLHYWFPVYDTEFSAYAPGRILFRRVLEAVALKGVRIIDRGEGDTPAKRDFANREHHFYRGLWSSERIRALPARAALALIWRLS